MMTYCRYCLFDIRKDNAGRWLLAWSSVDDDIDPYRCDARSDGHQPGASEA